MMVNVNKDITTQYANSFLLNKNKRNIINPYNNEIILLNFLKKLFSVSSNNLFSSCIGAKINITEMDNTVNIQQRIIFQGNVFNIISTTIISIIESM